MDKTIKAVVATVDIGHHKIQGLMLPNGDFAIAVTQIAEMFQINSNQAIFNSAILSGRYGEEVS